ncbi:MULTISPECIES: hypothetical protein [unclassified Acinetobacter]|uniref:hypothetical protein n=1 Tax=unclassified Acinetobacter TaxID=196816 RepID=UPI0035B88EFA
MALNVGENFKQRWLDAPEAVCACFERELRHVCDLLEPHTVFEVWQTNDQHLQRQHHIERKNAYAQLKQQILDQRRAEMQQRLQQRQAELEQQLQTQRQAEQQLLLDLREQEKQQQQQQLVALQAYAEQLKLQTIADKISKFDTTAHHHLSTSQYATMDNSILLDSKQAEKISKRLETECDNWLQNSMKQLRQQLQNAMQQELQAIQKQLQQQVKPVADTTTQHATQNHTQQKTIHQNSTQQTAQVETQVTATATTSTPNSVEKTAPTLTQATVEDKSKTGTPQQQAKSAEVSSTRSNHVKNQNDHHSQTSKQDRTQDLLSQFQSNLQANLTTANNLNHANQNQHNGNGRKTIHVHKKS